MKRTAWGAVLLTTVLGGAMNAAAQTSAASLIVKVFEMRVSTSSDCTGSITIFKTASPTPVDLVQNPTLGSGAVADGTFHCFMYQISDMITATPAADDGLCTVAGAPYLLDIFNSTDQSLTPPPGTSIQGHTGVEDFPWIYFSDSSVSAPGNNCFQPTENCNCGAAPCSLIPLTLTKDETRTLVVNFSAHLNGVGSCTLNAPGLFSVR